MNVLSLFSGIGGIDLGLERAGMRVVAQCETDPFCRAVLSKHWPGVPCFDDVRALAADALPDRVDLIAGGFPCQDVSAAGKGAGIGGERSGLWREMARLVAECRPTWVLVENVPALRTRGADRVLSDLEALGYDAWPVVVGAWAVGAPHRRDRVWIVARLSDPERDALRELEQRGSPRRPGGVRDQGEAEPPGVRVVAHAAGGGRGAGDGVRPPEGKQPDAARAGPVVAHAHRGGWEIEWVPDRQPGHEGAPGGLPDGRDGAGVGDPEHDGGRADEPGRGSQGRASARGAGAGELADPDDRGLRADGSGGAARADADESGANGLVDAHGAGPGEPGEGDARLGLGRGPGRGPARASGRAGLADADRSGRRDDGAAPQGAGREARRAALGGSEGRPLADAPGVGMEGDGAEGIEEPEVPAGPEVPRRDGGGMGDSERGGRDGVHERGEPGHLAADAGVSGGGSEGGPPRWPARPGEQQQPWEAPRLTQFPVGGAVDGLPVRLARFANRNALKALGNSVVPEVVEAIGRAILKAAE